MITVFSRKLPKKWKQDDSFQKKEKGQLAPKKTRPKTIRPTFRRQLTPHSEGNSPNIQKTRSIVWDPYLQKDTHKLEKVQRQAARFITGNYTSRNQDCVSQMLAELNLDFLTPVRGKRLIKSKQYTDCVTSNIIEKQSTNNNKCFKTAQCKTEIYKNSFLPRAIIDWNHFDDNIVRTETVESFRKAVHHWD